MTNPTNPSIDLWNKIEQTKGLEQKKIFLKYCLELVKQVQDDTIREEEAAYYMAGAFSIEGIRGSNDLDPILDATFDAEIPRESNYLNPDPWDKKTADRIKQDQWKLLLQAIKEVEVAINSNIVGQQKEQTG